MYWSMQSSLGSLKRIPCSGFPVEWSALIIGVHGLGGVEPGSRRRTLGAVSWPTRLGQRTGEGSSSWSRTPPLMNLASTASCGSAEQPEKPSACLEEGSSRCSILEKHTELQLSVSQEYACRLQFGAVMKVEVMAKG